MVSCLYSFNPFIGLMKLASTSAAIMYNSMENKQPWQTSQASVKGSDRRPFISILHSILVYASSTTWMNLSPYLKLRKAEKLKSQWTLKILQKDFIQFTRHIFYSTNSRKNVKKYSILNGFWLLFTNYCI